MVNANISFDRSHGVTSYAFGLWDPDYADAPELPEQALNLT
jgi:hypothetical protein